MRLRAQVLVGMIVVACLLSGVGLAAQKAADAKAATAAPAPAAAPAAGGAIPAGQYKIGVIDTKAVLTGYNKVSGEYKKLQEEVDARNKEMDKMLEKIQAEDEAYKKERDSLSTTDKTERETKIQNELRQYKAEMEKQQTDIDGKENLLKRRFLGDIQQAVAEIGAQDGYHIILTSSSSIYFSPTIDISQKVVDLLNSKP